jgi:hypothetical protein
MQRRFRDSFEGIKMDELGLIDALCESLRFVGVCYTDLVEIVNFAPQHNQVGASGTCPHCNRESYFRPVGSPYFENNNLTICNAAQCEACKAFVLVVGLRAHTSYQFTLKAFYPLGRPDDRVDDAVPPKIAEDFKEALRCRWVNAYKATVTLCRRVIQSSCLAQGADKEKKLVVQIDDLAAKAVITEPLRQFAHAVRLEGNDGAHPDPEDLESVTSKDADDIIEFTREYLHHVYVMPAKLAARKGPAAPAAAASGAKP